MTEMCHWCGTRPIPETRASKRGSARYCGAACASKAAAARVDPAHARARGVLLRAVRAGLIHRPERCPLCGRRGRIIGHHLDHGKPLDVAWMCNPCHITIHRYRDPIVA